MGLLLIAACASSFLHVVLERARNISVNYQPDIGLIDAHAERICGNDYFKFAVDKAVLNVFLRFGWQIWL